jgi:biopolymer transport protein ExbD
MEGTKIKVSNRKKARIEIIPLIDVIFFLLATFVLFTLSLNRIQSVKVDLPSTNPSPIKDKAEPTTIQVSGDGAIYWNRDLVDMADLPALLAQYKNDTDDPKILIAGDEKARFGDTVLVLDEVRKAGIETFSVETRTRPTGK